MTELKHYKNYIAGQWIDSNRRIDVINPATGEVMGSIARAEIAQVNDAVSAARKCVDQSVLSNMKPVERSKMVHRISVEIQALAEEAAPVLVAENGKTHTQAMDEFANAARYFEYYAGMADKIEGKSIPLGEDYVDFTYYEPIGVSAQVVPWNFPVDLCARSLAPALAAGCAVVVKSPELTPLAMTYIAQACERAGVPAGAVTIICGYGHDAGAALVAHPDVDQIVFTGSVQTGKSILHAAADNATPCVMELGGKSAAVVFPDADLDQLMASVDWGIFFNAGQVCSAMSRLLVHIDIHDEVIARVKALAESQAIGEGSHSATTLTPVASQQQHKKVLEFCQRGVADGAELVTGGMAAQRPGYFIEPTVFKNVLPEMELFSDEVFGPVLAVSQFATEEQAWAMANATEFGLVAGIFTRDLNIALRGSKALKAGQIFVNEWYAGGVETPFGGIKSSGFGREKGQEALYSYVNTKNVAIKLTRI